MKNWQKYLGLGLVLMVAALGFGCGDTTLSSAGSGSGSNTGISALEFYSQASDTTPVFTPTAGSASVPSGMAIGSWESGNSMYELFYTLRQYTAATDAGVIDRTNIYCLLYDVETLFASMTNEVVELSSAQAITPPYDFGNNATYEAAINDTTDEKAAAMSTVGNITKGIVTWIWREDAYPDKREVGILETEMNTATNDISVDFIFCVDYNDNDTGSDYNNRTKITGNSGTHTFEFVQTIGGSVESSKLVQIVGKGVSQGSDNNMLFKMQTNSNDGFNTAGYLVLSAEATEATLRNFDVTGEVYTSTASLPSTVDDYVTYVESTDFFTFSDLLVDLANLNSGNTREGTIYLDF